MTFGRSAGWALAALAQVSLAAPPSDGSGNKTCTVTPPSYSNGTKTCTVKSSNGTADDSPAIASALAQCSSGGTVLFEHGVDYNVYTPVEATNLTDVTMQMYGNLHLPQNVTYMQEYFNSTGESSIYWFTFEGPGLHYEGTSDINNGWIYSYGQLWWDANPAGKTGLAGRPHLFEFTTEGGSISQFKSRKPIAWGLSLHGNDITVTDTIIDAYSTGGFPFNTDGIGVKGTNVNISRFTIYNGDDAVAVTSGAHNVYVSDGAFGYGSHGLSIGSLGSNQASIANVSNIHFDDITAIDCLYASRIKTWQGGQGIAEDITWTNIKVYNVTFPIFVTQTYIDQGNAGAERPNNSSVIMKGLEWRNFTGTINTFQPGDGSCVTDVSFFPLPFLCVL